VEREEDAAERPPVRRRPAGAASRSAATASRTPGGPAGAPRRPDAPPLPRRGRAPATAASSEAPGDVTIDLRDGERIGGIWQRPVEEPAETPAAADGPVIAGSDRYPFSLAVGNSYCYACGRFAMHQIVLEANQPTRARRLGAYRCRCTLCEYLSSPQPSEIHRAEEHLAASKPGAWSRARRAVGVGHRAG
jgi:hypothetical protein